MSLLVMIRNPKRKMTSFDYDLMYITCLPLIYNGITDYCFSILNLLFLKRIVHNFEYFSLIIRI